MPALLLSKVRIRDGNALPATYWSSTCSDSAVEHVVATRNAEVPSGTANIHQLQSLAPAFIICSRAFSKEKREERPTSRTLHAMKYGPHIKHEQTRTSGQTKHATARTCCAVITVKGCVKNVW